MKKRSLPAQLGILFISIYLSWLIIYFIFDLACKDGVPDSYDPILVVLAILCALTVVLIINYNDVYRAKSEITKLKEDVISALETRNSLIDRAEGIVDKYAENEKEVFKAFAEARKSDNKISVKFKNVVEQYPEMKSNTAVISLLDQLDKTENVILSTRNRYTRAAAEYNAMIYQFPVVILKPIFKWKEEDIKTIYEQSSN